MTRILVLQQLAADQTGTRQPDLFPCFSNYASTSTSTSTVGTF
jgi:hypothetical protein